MPPGPEVTTHTPTSPVYLAWPQAANAHSSSCIVWTNSIRSLARLRASMIPLTPSPG
jgi:hypothetical protein